VTVRTDLNALADRGDVVCIHGGSTYPKAAPGRISPSHAPETHCIAEKVLQDFNFSKAFFGAWGITSDGGLAGIHLTEVEVKRAIVKRVQRVTASGEQHIEARTVA